MRPTQQRVCPTQTRREVLERQRRIYHRRVTNVEHRADTGLQSPIELFIAQVQGGHWKDQQLSEGQQVQYVAQRSHFDWRL